MHIRENRSCDDRAEIVTTLIPPPAATFQDELTIYRNHIIRFISNQEYEKACVELISCLQSLCSKEIDQTYLESICLLYEQVIKGLEKSEIRKELIIVWITFLKGHLQTHSLAIEKLINCIEALINLKAQPNLSEAIEVYLNLDDLCQNSDFSALIRKTLYSSFQRIDFFQEVKLPMKSQEEFQLVLEASKIAFGHAWPCMRTQLVRGLNELKKKNAGVYAPLEMNYIEDAHFATALKEALKNFRVEYKELFKTNPERANCWGFASSIMST